MPKLSVVKEPATVAAAPLPSVMLRVDRTYAERLKLVAAEMGLSVVQYTRLSPKPATLKLKRS